MKFKKIYFLSLVFSGILFTQYSLAAPMEGVDEFSNEENSSEVVNVGGNRQAKGAKKESSILPIVALLLGISGAGIGLLTMLKENKLEERNAALKKTYEKDAAMMKSEISNLVDTVSNLKIQLADYQNVLEKFVTSFKVSSSTPTRQPVTEAHAYSASDSTQKEKYTQPQAPVAPVKLFFGIPVQGCFTNPSTTYVPGKSLYSIMVSQGANTAQYSYIDNPDAASIASRSISRFVEVGCVIHGDIRNNFSKIVTVKPGTVSKTPSGWKIDSKAVVELV